MANYLHLENSPQYRSNEKGPAYYKRGQAEVWDFIRDNNLNFHLGNAVKYIARAGYKDSKKEDLIKAIHYLENELEHTINATAAGQGIPEGVPSANLEDRIPKVGTEGLNRRRVQRISGSGGFTV